MKATLESPSRTGVGLGPPPRRRGLLVWACAIALALTAWAQFRGRGRPAFDANGAPVDRGDVPTWPLDAEFARDSFTFARLKYNSSRPERTSYAWWTDYPDADLNLSYRLHQLTSLKVNPDPKIVEITDPALFDYPWVIMSGPGNIDLTRQEAEILRRYLTTGGFLMVDDFWGQAEWDGVHRALKQIFPDREPEDLPRSDRLFHGLFNIPDDRPLQTPNMRAAIAGRDAGITWEDGHAGGNTRDVHFRALRDDRGRIVVLLCHNTDNGDGWEMESVDSWYFSEFSEKKSYPLGFNILIYALTH